MILEEICLENFRSHRKTCISLDEGITVIVGENGSGKTSILEAVNFALFKQKPSDVNVDDLIMRGASEAKVSVRFYSGGRNFLVTRGRKPKRAAGSSLYEITDGKESLILQGEEDITGEIENTLGLGGDLFTSAVYIKQGDIDSLFAATAGVRKEQVGRLLGAHDLETAHKNMREVLNEYENRLRSFEMVLERIPVVKESIKESREEVTTFKGRLQAIKSSAAEEEKGLSEKEGLMETFERLKDLRAVKKEYAMELTGVRERLKKIEHFEKTLVKVKDKEVEYKKADHDLKGLQREMQKQAGLQERESSLRKDRERLDAKKESMKIDISRLFDRYSRVLEAEIGDVDDLTVRLAGALEKTIATKKEAEERLEGTATEIGALNGANLELEKALHELESAGENCPVCSNPLTPEHKDDLMAEYQEKTRANISKIKVLAGRKAEVEKEHRAAVDTQASLGSVNIEMLGSKVKETKEMEGRLKHVTRDLEGARKDLEAFANVDSQVEELKGRLRALQEAHETYIAARGFLHTNVSERDNLGRDAKRFLEQISSIDAEIEEIAEGVGGIPSPEDHAALKDEIRNLRAKVNNLKVQASGLDSSLQAAQRTLEVHKAELESLGEKKAESKRLETFVDLLKEIRGLFHKDRLQKDLRVTARPLIEQYTREIFDAFNLPYTDIELTDDFSMMVYGPAGEESVDMLSGGEKIAAALALRLGIAKALSGPAMELIILDEPTIHLDSLRRRELVDIIRHLSTIPQTIVVTHDKEFEEAADTLIVVEKEGGISKVKEDEE